MSRVAVILSGCGFLDGAEIHESVLLLLALSQKGHSYHCFAPDKLQTDVMNHLMQEPADETRNVLVESARIARGEISPLDKLSHVGYDALVMPGGFGVAKNLSSFATEQDACLVDPDFSRAVLEFHKAGKPIGATCIAPAPLAKIFQEAGISGVRLTLGSSPENAALLTAMGASGQLAGVDSVIADVTHKIYSTPCYMDPPDLPGMFVGVTALIDQLLPE